MTNLDCISPEELWMFWLCYCRSSRAAAVKLFGGAHPNCVRAARNCAHYAANKATAMACRERGDIVGALKYERICDRIYKALPAFARW